MRTRQMDRWTLAAACVAAVAMQPAVAQDKKRPETPVSPKPSPTRPTPTPTPTPTAKPEGKPQGKPTAAAKTRSFFEVVRAFAGRWDRDHNGVISEAEIDALVIDPYVKGEHAAAVGAIKNYMRIWGSLMPQLTPEYLAAEEKRSKPSPEDDKEPSLTEFSFGLDWNKAYTDAMKRISVSGRELYKNDKLDITQFHQGQLGDCYFVSLLGGMVHRNPDAVRRMITPLPNGGYKVSFGDDRPVTITALTDAEIATSSTTGDEGLWVAVFEKAFGTLRRRQFPNEHKDTKVATDTIAQGGSPTTTIRVLTGKEPDEIALRDSTGEVRVVDGQRVTQVKPVATESEVTRIVREKIIAALSRNKLVGVGTFPERLPPGISGQHAYAVVGYDKATDRLEVWNPHGNTHTPRGEPGLKFGYPTKAGLFWVPASDFPHIFAVAFVEADRSAVTEGQRGGN